MGSPVVHFEFWSEEQEKVAEFYEEAFDWRIHHLPHTASYQEG